MIDIQELLQTGESETVEFKQSWTNDCLKTLAAFANTNGGTLLVDVNDAGQIIGWDGGDKQQQAIATRIGNKLPIQPSLAVEEAGELPVLVIRVDEAQGMAVPYESRYYRRVGCTTQEVPPEQLGQFLLERTGQSWDALACDAAFDEINEQAVHSFCRRAANRLPNVSDDEPFASVLQKLGLVNQGRLTNAAILLFGAHPQRRFISANVHMGRFKDSITILDDRMFEGTLFDQVDAVMLQFRQYLQVRYDIGGEVSSDPDTPVVHRREVWDYPLDALLEAVVNALIHRTYFGSTESVTIRVFDDRVLIRNPGGLPSGITVEQLKQEPHPTIPRNPLLANVLYYAELVEKWGSGTTRIVGLCRDQGVPEPEYEATDYAFAVSFKQETLAERLRRHSIKEGQLRALVFLEEHGRITNSEYQQIAGVKERQASKDLTDLERRGMMVRVGTTGRGTYYILPAGTASPEEE